MNWSFFPNSGGQESGFHDAGVETFKGNLERYLAREIIQNSLDARDDPAKPVVVKFEILTLSAADIPDMKGLSKALGRCTQYWKKDKKAVQFFTKAERLAKAKTIHALRASDSNTKGVTGTDTDRSNCWYSLIRCSGASSKLAGEGGSFGIGKNAPFAASDMRVVLYSTLTKDKQYAFQGVAKLVSHEHPNGGIAQHIGYLGDKKGGSIRDKRDIPPPLLRTRPGTDIVVLGYSSGASAAKDLIFSVLENFWPAIRFEELEVIVAGTPINADTLSDLLEEYSTEDEFSAHLYHKALTASESKHISASLPTLGKVELYLLAGEQGLPKKVAMIRKTGMVIYHQHFRSLVPYCGVFLCRNNSGNLILREMEPPRHDIWDQNHPDKNAHKKTYLELTGFIRESVQNLAPADTEKELNIPDLSHYLPDDDDSPEDSFDGAEPSRHESFERQPQAQPIRGRRMDRSRSASQVDETEAEGEGEDPNSEDGENGTQGGGTKKNGQGGGSGGGGEGGGGDGTKGSKGGRSGDTSRALVPIRSRVFATNLAGGVYSVVVATLKPTKIPVFLSIRAIGDDTTKSAVIIAKAVDPSNKAVGMPKAGTIGPIKLTTSSQTLVITLAEPRKLAMEVDGYETE